MHNPFGKYILALVATPPSPLELAKPVPAYVVIIPVDAVTLRTRWLFMSLKYMLPLESIAIPAGWLREALVAAPLSPPNPPWSEPAKVLIIPWPGKKVG